MTIGDEKVVRYEPRMIGIEDRQYEAGMYADLHGHYVLHSAYASLLEEKNQVAAENERLRSPFTEEQGRELRDFVQPKDGTPTTITYAQWDAICGFVSEGDRVEDALRQRMLDAESQLAELRGNLEGLASEYAAEAERHLMHAANKDWAEWVRADHSSRASELNGAAREIRTLAAADGGGG